MKLLIIDIETSGLNEKIDHIVEVAGVLLNTRNGKIKDKFSYLINEYSTNHNDRYAWIYANSDLTFEDVKTKGLDWKQVGPKLQKLFNKYKVTCYNHAFDFRFLESRGFNFPIKFMDPMIYLTDVLKLGSNLDNYKWPSVQEVINYYGWDVIEPHRALGDARIEARIVYEILKGADKS